MKIWFNISTYKIYHGDTSLAPATCKGETPISVLYVVQEKRRLDPSGKHGHTTMVLYSVNTRNLSLT
jgi:hypothetical protein